MRCYLIRDTKVTILAAAPAAVPNGALLISRTSELDPKRFPVTKLLSIHNTLPGISQIKRFSDRKQALRIVWNELSKLPISSSRSSSKQALVICLLRRPEGCDLEEMQRATGWQVHSIRGLMAGTLRQRLGLKVESTKTEGRRVYRLPA